MAKRLPPLPARSRGSAAGRQVPTWLMTIVMGAALLRLSPSPLRRRLTRPRVLLAPRRELKALLRDPRALSRTPDGRRTTLRHRLAVVGMLVGLLGADWWFRTGRRALVRVRAAMENDLVRGSLAAVPVVLGIVIIVR
jgi:hypothetical protein